MRGRRQGVRLDIVVRVAQIVGHEAHDREEDRQDQRQREQVLDDEIGPEGQGVLFGLFLAGAAHLDARRVVVARRVEGPHMHDHQARDDEGQQVMQREEAVQRRVADRRSAQQPGLQRLSHAGDGAEQAGDHGRAPEGHLAPRQHISHEGGRHHQDVDQHADDPGDLARGLVAAVVEAAENVQIDRHEEQRRAAHVDIAQHMPAIHVAHDVLDAGEGHVDMRGIVHHQHDTGDDLQQQTEDQDDAPDPHPVQVLGRGDHQRVVEQPRDGQSTVQPILEARLGLVMVVRYSGHDNPP